MQLKTCFLFIFFLVAYILPLGFHDFIIPDETRYAEIPREMIATGDWVVPHLNGLRYFEKPAMGYWVHAGSMLLFGENNFSVRLPSALAVGASALLIYLMLHVLLANSEKGKPPAGLASLVFLSCFEVFGVGSTAVLDSLLSFFLTATIILFYLATEATSRSRKERGLLALSGLFCGMAFLTKGFLALAVPVLVLAPYLVWQRRCLDLLRMGWLPILIAVLVSLPWSILVQLRAPDFWHYFFWNEHIRRFLASNAQHKESFGFFFMVAPAMFMPWIPLVPAALIGLRKGGETEAREKRFIRFAICWLILPFLFFSCSKGKLLTYILPCFPPFAILMALGIDRYLKRGAKVIFQVGAIGNALLFGLLLMALVVFHHRSFDGIPLYSLPEKPVMAAIGIVVCIVMFVQAYRHKEAAGRGTLLFGFAPLCLFFLLRFFIPNAVIDNKMPGAFLQQHLQQVGNKDLVIVDAKLLQAVCWYWQRDDIYILDSPRELRYGLSYPEAKGRLLDRTTVRDLINQNRGRVVLIATDKFMYYWRDQLPKPVQAIESKFGRNVIMKW